ncbi:hypothetical protein TNCV_3261421 [Trichonephila clavipes]|nr:hypothetical protein TNCV_3261421 [Trichonephila clavipes]
MPSEVPVDRWDGVDGLAIRRPSISHTCSIDSSPNDIPIDVACQRYTLNMQISSGKHEQNEPSCTTAGTNCQIPGLIWRCNSRATCAVTSTHITIILESLPKPGDDTLRFQVPPDTSSWVRPYSSRPIILPRKNQSDCFFVP